MSNCEPSSGAVNLLPVRTGAPPAAGALAAGVAISVASAWCYYKNYANPRYAASASNPLAAALKTTGEEALALTWLVIIARGRLLEAAACSSAARGLDCGRAMLQASVTEKRPSSEPSRRLRAPGRRLRAVRYASLLVCPRSTLLTGAGPKITSPDRAQAVAASVRGGAVNLDVSCAIYTPSARMVSSVERRFPRSISGRRVEVEDRLAGNRRKTCEWADSLALFVVSRKWKIGPAGAPHGA